MRINALWITAIAAALALRCGVSPNAGGTTDTGNAKVAGVIHTSDGNRAANTAVTVCPAQYHSAIGADSSEQRLQFVKQTFTDDTGYFGIDTIDAGTWSIEVNDGSASAVLLNVEVAPQPDSAVRIDGTLKPYSAIKGTVGAFDDTTVERYLVVYGLERRIPVARDGAFSIDDLPAGTYQCRIIAEQDAWTPLDLDTVTVAPAETVTVAVADSTDAVTIDTAEISLNTTASGAGVPVDVYGFPVLVRLTEDNFDFAGTEDGGGNVRFVNMDGTPLPFAIELWDSLQGTAFVWVRLDTIFGNDSSRSFLMLWGNSAALPAPGGGAVFGAAGGFLACYHLGGTLEDATGNGYNGIDSGTANTGGGIIGRARGFNGSSFVTIGDLPDRERGTISFWFRPGVTIDGVTNSTQGIWGKKESDSVDFTISLGGIIGETNFYISPDIDAKGKLIAKLENPDAGYYVLSSTASFSAGVWYFAVWSWGDGGDSLYINSTLETRTPNSLILTGNAAEEIGRSRYDSQNILGGGPRYFNGTLDEFRIDTTCRSAAWIRLCYMNQQADDKLVTVKRAGE